MKNIRRPRQEPGQSSDGSFGSVGGFSWPQLGAAKPPGLRGESGLSLR